MAKTSTIKTDKNLKEKKVKVSKKSQDMLDFKGMSKREIIKRVATDDNDTGSAEVQIALITKRVLELIDHLKTHKKDKHSRRGLLQMIGKRRRLLEYLKSKNEESYKETIKLNGLNR